MEATASLKQKEETRLRKIKGQCNTEAQNSNEIRMSAANQPSEGVSETQPVVAAKERGQEAGVTQR